LAKLDPATRMVSFVFVSAVACQRLRSNAAYPRYGHLPVLTVNDVAY
jgi:hypothetical protein